MIIIGSQRVALVVWDNQAEILDNCKVLFKKRRMKQRHIRLKN